MEGLYTFISEWWALLLPWLPYLIIPVSAAVIGWLTNRLAINMTFYPVEFKGKVLSDRYVWARIGWQGIIPMKATKMANLSTELILSHLIDIREIFDRLDPRRIAEELEPNVRVLARETVSNAMSENLPIIWATIAQTGKERIVQQVLDEFPHAVEEMMKEIKDEILDLWDVKAMVLEEIEQDKGIMNELFLRCGEEEFKFIEKSGFYFGFLFGLIQMVMWYFLEGYAWAWMTLPAAGLVVGYLTNAIALKMIFEPENPIKIGPVTFQGLLMKRQEEVSVEFGKVLSRRLFTIDNIFENIIYGRATDRIVQLVEKHVNDVVDKTAGLKRSLIQIASGTSTYTAIKQMAVDTFRRELPKSLSDVFSYAENALDIEDTIADKMKKLPADEFLSFMRPAFKEDEWKLILIGAMLGMGAGFLQSFFLVF